jgi:hypothetical protein
VKKSAGGFLFAQCSEVAGGMRTARARALCAAAKHILEQYAHRAGELRCETGRRPRWDASLWTNKIDIKRKEFSALKAGRVRTEKTKNTDSCAVK